MHYSLQTQSSRLIYIRIALIAKFPVKSLIWLLAFMNGIFENEFNFKVHVRLLEAEWCAILHLNEKTWKNVQIYVGLCGSVVFEQTVKNKAEKSIKEKIHTSPQIALKRTHFSALPSLLLKLLPMPSHIAWISASLTLTRKARRNLMTFSSSPGEQTQGGGGGGGVSLLSGETH